MRRIALLTAVAAVALMASVASAIPFLHEDIATGGLDPDGDHYLTVAPPGPADPMPGVYCAEGHADVNRNSGVTAQDLGLVLVDFGVEPPASPFNDQNHNDQGDYLDILHEFKEIGGTIVNSCGSAVADPPMPAGLGGTSGPDLTMAVVYTGAQPPAPPPWGDITVTVSTAGAFPDPYSGYWINIRFNELSVAGVSGSFTELSPLTSCDSNPQVLDNSDDVPAVDDGSFKNGCGSLRDGTATVAVAGPLASFTFDRIGAAAPNFCLGTFGAPDMGLALRGTYTLAPDMGAQAQTNTAGSADTDGDGVGNCVDNCQLIANPGQANNDEAGGTFGGTVPPAPPWILDANDPDGAFPGVATIGGDACDPNDDNNGCADGMEALEAPPRSDVDPWDWADMWVPSLDSAPPPAGSGRSGAIGLPDVVATLPWVGRLNGGPPGPGPGFRDYDSDVNTNGVEDGAEYDRTPVMGMPGISGPPNGAVSLADVGVVLAQVGDAC